jgi:hypothetical protein
MFAIFHNDRNRQHTTSAACKSWSSCSFLSPLRWRLARGETGEFPFHLLNRGQAGLKFPGQRAGKLIGGDADGLFHALERVFGDDAVLVLAEDEADVPVGNWATSGCPFKSVSRTEVNWATAGCPIVKSPGYSAANCVINLMFRSENPFTSGISLAMSLARRGMTPAPQPSFFCMAMMARPMSQ